MGRLRSTTLRGAAPADAGMEGATSCSELPELLTVCDRILVLSEGRLTAEFRRGEASEAKILEAAMAASAAS